MQNETAESIGSETIPTAIQPEHSNTETEQRLTADIAELWSVHVQAQRVVTKTKEELKTIRTNLGERLHAMKQLLSRPGRNGGWSSFLQSHGIPRTSADRLVSVHARSLSPATNVTIGAVVEPTQADVLKFFNGIWPRIEKTLTTHQSIYDFICFTLTRSKIAHEWRDIGILMFHPAVVVPDPPYEIEPQETTTASEDADFEDVF